MLCRDWLFLSDECVVHAILRIFFTQMFDVWYIPVLTCEHTFLA
jgi:hypothetical protein